MVQAKDIPEAWILGLIPRWPQTISGWDLADHPGLREYPYKVVLAKLRSLYKRKLVNGCPCGCRGDWCRPVAGCL
jgi:hypothetical protein